MQTYMNAGKKSLDDSSPTFQTWINISVRSVQGFRQVRLSWIANHQKRNDTDRFENATMTPAETG